MRRINSRNSSGVISSLANTEARDSLAGNYFAISGSLAKHTTTDLDVDSANSVVGVADSVLIEAILVVISLHSILTEVDSILTEAISAVLSVDSVLTKADSAVLSLDSILTKAISAVLSLDSVLTEEDSDFKEAISPVRVVDSAVIEADSPVRVVDSEDCRHVEHGAVCRWVDLNEGSVAVLGRRRNVAKEERVTARNALGKAQLNYHPNDSLSA
jgi:hypothetical protein